MSTMSSAVLTPPQEAFDASTNDASKTLESLTSLPPTPPLDSPFAKFEAGLRQREYTTPRTVSTTSARKMDAKASDSAWTEQPRYDEEWDSYLGLDQSGEWGNATPRQSPNAQRSRVTRAGNDNTLDKRYEEEWNAYLGLT